MRRTFDGVDVWCGRRGCVNRTPLVQSWSTSWESWRTGLRKESEEVGVGSYRKEGFSLGG